MVCAMCQWFLRLGTRSGIEGCLGAGLSHGQGSRGHWQHHACTQHSFLSETLLMGTGMHAFSTNAMPLEAHNSQVIETAAATKDKLTQEL